MHWIRRLLVGVWLTTSSAAGGVNILPTPEETAVSGRSVALRPGSIRASDALSREADYLRRELERRGVSPFEMTLALDGDRSLGPEGYRLDISQAGISIRARAGAGVFYGIQSLLQIAEQADGGKVPCVRITDGPKYPWRSFMIDSGRQYQKVATIKGLIDRIAMLKLNVLHWHLTENDGWRVEIKRCPKLTEVGSRVADGPEQHGFYSRDDVRDIVAYARERHVKVVPEIDVPGHSDAALRAYPELSCSGRPPPRGRSGHSACLYCAGSERTYEFLGDVMDEVCELFPSEYVHIGGDEAPKREWDRCRACQAKIRELGLKDSHELQIHMTNRLAELLARKGRKAICWGDVVHRRGPKLAENVIVHWWNWRRHKNRTLREAILRGKKVIANTNYYTYLNFPQKHVWKGYRLSRTFDFRKCYEANPCDLRRPSTREKEALLGMGTCLWTDMGLTEEWLDRRMYPRIYALAEQMWHIGERLGYAEFRRRVYRRRSALAKLGIGGDWDEEH